MIILATDHAGYEHKEALKKHLKNFVIKDFGTDSKESCDYPDFIIPAAKEVAKDKSNIGIIFGGSGQGEAMAANRIKNIRATAYYSYNEDILKLSKTHNNANILSIGARFISIEEMIKSVDIWLKTKFLDEERHIKRINKIDILS